MIPANVRAVLGELLADARLSPFHDANNYDLGAVEAWLDTLPTGDDAITAEALRAAGWEYDPSIGTEVIAYADGPEDEDAILDKAWTLKLTELSLARRAKTMHVYFSEYLSGETISVLVVAYSEADDMEMAFPGCTTMTQLAQLVEMLGGAA